MKERWRNANKVEVCQELWREVLLIFMKDYMNKNSKRKKKMNKRRKKKKKLINKDQLASREDHQELLKK